MNCVNCNSEHVVKAGKTRGGNQIYICRDCDKRFTYLPPKPCEDCNVILDNYKNSNKKLCPNCFKKREREQKRSWWKKTRETRNEYHRDYYWDNPSFRKQKINQNNINNNKRLGSSGLGPHLSNHCGDIDFELEEQTVKNEVKRILRYGTHRYNKDAVKWAEYKLDCSRAGVVQYLAPPSIYNFEDVCGHCYWASFPNGCDEKGICKLGKRPDGIWDISLMCCEVLEA